MGAASIHEGSGRLAGRFDAFCWSPRWSDTCAFIPSSPSCACVELFRWSIFSALVRLSPNLTAVSPPQQSDSETTPRFSEADCLRGCSTSRWNSHAVAHRMSRLALQSAIVAATSISLFSLRMWSCLSSRPASQSPSLSQGSGRFARRPSSRVACGAEIPSW